MGKLLPILPFNKFILIVHICYVDFSVYILSSFQFYLDGSVHILVISVYAWVGGCRRIGKQSTIKKGMCVYGCVWVYVVMWMCVCGLHPGFKLTEKGMVKTATLFSLFMFNRKLYEPQHR